MNFNEKFNQAPNATGLVGHFIAGQLTYQTERTQNIYNPATGEITKQVALADTQTVEHAIAVAQAAFPAIERHPAQSPDDSVSVPRKDFFDRAARQSAHSRARCSGIFLSSSGQSRR